jgi:hypothetical protein
MHKDSFRVLLGFPNHSAPKISQASHLSQQSKHPSLFYPACTTRENGPPPFSATKSLRQSSLIQAPAQLIQNLDVGTLMTRSYEKCWTQANASQTCRPQVAAGSLQRPLQPTISWLIIRQFGSLSQAKTRMMDG